MIATVTMNPAIDKTLIVNGFKINKVNKILDTFETAGGKGINVSKTVNLLGGDTIALGFVGGSNGLMIQNILSQLKIPTDFLFINQNTRVNFKIYDSISRTTTELNDCGLPFDDDALLHKISRKIIDYSKVCSFISFNGSIPMSTHFYSQLISDVSQNTKTALDCSGETLAMCVKARPFIIKPNETELIDTFNLKSHNAIVKCSLNLIDDYDIKYVLLSRGSEGSLLISKNNIYKATPINIDAKITTGAGDAMLGGFLFAYEKYNDEILAYKYAVACATASVMGEFNFNTVIKLLDDVIIN